MAQDFVLYGHYESGNVYKVALMLALCGEAFRFCHVDIFDPVCRSSPHSWKSAASARSRRSAMATQHLVQSAAILQYLAERLDRFGPVSEAHRWAIQRVALLGEPPPFARPGLDALPASASCRTMTRRSLPFAVAARKSCPRAPGAASFPSVLTSLDPCPASPTSPAPATVGLSIKPGSILQAGRPSPTWLARLGGSARMATPL